jgi:hydroxyacylglutathione hydrolase
VAEIEQVTLSMDGFEVNAYVVHGPEGDMVVDAGAEPEKILARVRQPVEAVLITHSHADHVSALSAVLRETNAPLYVHPDDADRTGVSVYEPFDDGQELQIAGERLLVLHTPGHSP